MTIIVSVENIKCGGCANSIRKQLSEVESVVEVDVDTEQGQISIQTSGAVSDQTLRLKLLQMLLKMGYPETGSVEGLQSVGAKAKSFVSCAVGRMSDGECK